MNAIKTILWLDDIRDPRRSPWISMINKVAPDAETITWVKNYAAFVEYIETKGLPDLVCFDNDLAEEMEGYDCAKYLVNYCVEREIHTPRFICQSSNQPAVENITALINNYNKFISALD
jgi:hypothetical protein